MSSETNAAEHISAGDDLVAPGRGILLVEDELLVREVTGEVLAAAGYVVW